MQTVLPFEQNHSNQTRQFSRPTPVPSVSSIHLADSQREVSKAERVLLELADYIYAHTPLKPISKTLFFISRCLLVARKSVRVGSLSELRESYVTLCSALGRNAPTDDFDYQNVSSEYETHASY